MLNSNSRVAVYMEGHIDSDYGKMGMGIVRYIKNPIVGVVDKAFEGRSMKEFINISRDIKIYGNLQDVINLGAEVLILGLSLIHI